ncbi:MAG: DinB family protein [Bacillota bacterium]|nr:DinB family protein [Bacillota bacterium]
MLQRPKAGEFPPYYESYIQLVPEGEIILILEESLTKTVSIFQSISESKGNFRYAPEKWSIKEVLGHMTDTERILSVRLLRIGRGDENPLPGFNENHYIKGSNYCNLPIQRIVEEFILVRKATIALLRNMPEEAWLRKGVANNFENTTRALAYIIAGHELHHCQIIKERYLRG